MRSTELRAAALVAVSLSVAFSGCSRSGHTFLATAAPTVGSISPNTGPSTGGTTVNVAGTGFDSVTVITLGGLPLVGQSLSGTSLITGKTPPNTTLGPVDVVATNAFGSGTLKNGFTYTGPVTVASISPSSGPTAGGTSVTITGSGFVPGTTVTIGGASLANTSIVSLTQITGTTPAGAAGAANVVVTNSTGTATLTGGYTYVSPSAVKPTISSITPNTGSNLGATPITITGSNFIAGTTVTIGGAAVTSLTIVNSGTITAGTPAGTNGAQPVVLTTANGVANSTFTYGDPPTFTNVSPTTGSDQGGTVITINGTFLLNATVTIGGVPLTGVSINVGGTQLTGTTPAGTNGAQNIVITTPFGTVTAFAAFTFGNAPTFTMITPNAGSDAGGTSITITGTNLSNATSVTIGTATVAIGANTATQITGTIPAGAFTDGNTNVVVTTPFGTVTATNAFQFGKPPTVTSVSPAGGSTTGGTRVTVNGTNFVPGQTTVKFGIAASTSVTVTFSTVLVSDSPAQGAGTVDVTVTTPFGTSPVLAADQFTYSATAAPTVNSVAPNQGPPAGGTANIVITGSGFTGVTAVSFGANTAAFVVNSGTQITATSPAGALGTVDVTVTANGTSATSAADQFTYTNAPVITNVSPDAGVLAGGTAITITGNNFTGSTGGTLGGVALTNFNVVSATQITANTPVHAFGSVNLVILNSNGNTTDTGAFFYENAPTVTAVAPASGPAAGGTVVTITGTNFTDATAVSFGATPAASFTVNSGTQITATSPAGAVGATDVTVTTPVATSATSAADQFTYGNPPTFLTVNPNKGSSAGGLSVTITGTNFVVGNTAVTIGGNAATTVVVAGAGSLTCNTPTGVAGQVDVVVTTPFGSATGSNAFTYGNPPTFQSVSPATGSDLGGTAITITGTGFLAGATGATIGGNAVTSFVVQNDTTITGVTPAGTDGSQPLVVNGPFGSASGTFTYGPPPTVSSTNPATGSDLGGTSVTITGTSFTVPAIVDFNGTPATAVTVVNGTTITCTTPAGADGLASVLVNTPFGTASAN